MFTSVINETMDIFIKQISSLYHIEESELKAFLDTIPVSKVTVTGKRVKRDYKFLEKYCNENSIILLKDYSKESVNTETTIEGVCIKCTDSFKKKFRLILKNGALCDKCMEEKRQIGRKKTSIERYGVDSALKSEVVKDKIKKTCLEKYGVENPRQSTEIKDKYKKTCLEKYGVENPQQTKEIREKTCATMIKKYGVENPQQSKEIREKTSVTMMKKYGVSHPSQSEEIKSRKRDTCMKNYGVEHPSQSEEVKDRKRDTCIENYGVEHPSQSEEIKSRKRDTCMKNYGVEYPLQSTDILEQVRHTNFEKYGVEHPLQNPEIFSNMVKSSFYTKEYLFTSGRIDSIQGYENFALDELILLYKEDDICTGDQVPLITYKINDKIHKHYPDIYIKCENKIIEVKSTWTFQLHKDKVLMKRQSAIELGFKYELWIYDKKGNKSVI